MNIRVPVVDKNNIPLMPTKASKARKLIDQGKALPKRNKLGVFYIQLQFEPSGYALQPISMGIDPGSCFTGIGIQTKKSSILGFNLILPRKQISKRLEERRILRRTRRSRRIKRSLPIGLRNNRQARFKNRKGNFLPPSIKASKDFELRIVNLIFDILPISKIYVEKVNNSSSKGFTRTCQGQKYFITELAKLSKVIPKKGFETHNLRLHLKLSKSENKADLNPSSHVHDALTLASFEFLSYNRIGLTNGHDWLGEVKITLNELRFFVVKRPTSRPRKLHLIQFSKGGVRKPYGGFNKIHSFRNGDKVIWKDKTIGFIQANNLYNWVNTKWILVKQLTNGKNLRLLERSKNLNILEVNLFSPA